MKPSTKNLRMKSTILAILAVLTGSLAMAQSSKQVSWTYSAKKIADMTYEVHMTATIGGDYHLYAQDAGGDGPSVTFRGSGCVRRMFAQGIGVIRVASGEQHYAE